MFPRIDPRLLRWQRDRVVRQGAPRTAHEIRMAVRRRQP